MDQRPQWFYSDPAMADEEPAAADRDEDSRRGIQSLEIGLRVIEVLAAADGPMTLKALSAGAGLRPSSCHRYLTSFVRSGFVVRDSRGTRYDLGPKIIHAGLRGLARGDAMAIALDAARELTEETGYSLTLAIWTPNGPTVVDWRPGRRLVRTSVAVGSALPLVSSATGRAFLSTLPPAVTAPVAFREGVDADYVERLVADVKRQGYASIESSLIPGLSAVAAPIVDCRGEATIVLTLVGLADGFTPFAIERLIEVCRKSSMSLGWMGGEDAAARDTSESKGKDAPVVSSKRVAKRGPKSPRRPD